MNSVLFVCTANQCRSPMAEVVFKAIIHEKEETGNWRVESAGAWTLDGRPATDKAQKVMSQRGLDLSNHHSRMVNRTLLSGFNLILTMEKAHKTKLQTDFPEIALKVFLFSEMVGKFEEVDDPIGGDEAKYERTIRQLENYIRGGYERIKRLSADAG